MKDQQLERLERIYAGLLGKSIGVRHGSNVEGWSREKIERVYGQPMSAGYWFDFKNFAADDDTNGPTFFVRALTDLNVGREVTSRQIAHTLLNYAGYGHGFFWWGSYGKSMECTAYRNLRAGIEPPRSGSVEQNGHVLAEQVGGQIFSDVWGLVCPGDYVLAAELARRASSVTHGGNGVYGGMFIAACISAAFSLGSLREVIEAGLSVIPRDCTYAKMAQDLIAFHKAQPNDWGSCFDHVRANYWVDKYPGGCHIIPNSALILIGLLYGEGDFTRSINICNLCGWDTDCNVGNLGTILGVMVGLDGIDEAWKKPVMDLMICSSTVGSLNMQDIPNLACNLALLSYQILNETLPQRLSELMPDSGLNFHFALRGSTHSFRVRVEGADSYDCTLRHDAECHATGLGALRASASTLASGDTMCIYHKTYYHPSDFNDSRYDPAFSPKVYPGQKLVATVMAPEIDGKLFARLYLHDDYGDVDIEGVTVELTAGQWTDLSWDIPAMDNVLIGQIGIKLIPVNGYNRMTLTALVDQMRVSGGADYALDYDRCTHDMYNLLHIDVSQHTYSSGLWELQDGGLYGSSDQDGDAFTGSHDWTDYTFIATLVPVVGDAHGLNFRTQGCMRGYLLMLMDGDRLVLMKRNETNRVLIEVDYPWVSGERQTLRVEAHGNEIRVSASDRELLRYVDEDMPYLKGQVGASILNGSRCRYERFEIRPLQP